jgi:L-fuculose-phosphate aldolase
MGDTSLRRAIVAAGVRLGARGLIAAGEGNLSVRLPDGRLLLTPSGRRKDELRDEDLLIVDADPGGPGPTSPSGLMPTSDLAIHRAVLAARRDAGAVVHAHLPASMALTLAGETPDASALPETALFLPNLPVVPFGAPGSEELAARIATAMQAGDPRPGAAVLERHGAIAVGDAARGPIGALEQAVDRLELVDVLCRATRDALLLRAARLTLERADPRVERGPADR